MLMCDTFAKQLFAVFKLALFQVTGEVKMCKYAVFLTAFIINKNLHNFLFNMVLHKLVVIYIIYLSHIGNVEAKI